MDLSDALRKTRMLRFRYKFLFRSYFALVFSLVASNAFCDGYLTSNDLQNINYQCYLEEADIVFCSEGDIANPQVIIKVPLLEPIKLSNGLRAYRVMATITNHTKRNLVGAKVSLSFDKEKKQSIDIMISEKIIYKGTSTVKRSHLIRPDVPQNKSLYNALDDVYLKADISNIKIRLKEIKFE